MIGFEIEKLLRAALEEDMPFGDITTDNLIDANSVSKAVLVCKQDGVIAGLNIAESVFKMLDGKISFLSHIKDGEEVKSGDIIVEIEGNTRAMLKAERTSLNILQHLSGIATKTKEYCRKVSNLPVKIADTRKTTAGLRMFEKYAVRVGGGSNHRFCLSDGVLIKDNHIAAAGGIERAIEKVKKSIPHTYKIEVETETFEQVEEAVSARADIIMLDNMSINDMEKAVVFINKRALVEASGNVSLENIYAIAKTGVDIISIGSLTHSVTALDISMKFE